MKKLIPLLIIVILTTATAYAVDTEDWYQYNGYSTSHSFSVKFPTDWQSKTYGDEMQGFAPEKVYGDSYFIIQEFEGETLDQAIQFYVNENTKLIETKDIFFSEANDLIAKEAIYLDTEAGKKYPRTIIKRGSLIVILSGRLLEDVEDFPIPSKYRETVEEIYNSFEFTDDFHQYIDLKDSFSFIFPSALEIETLSDGVTVVNPDNKEIIFSVFKYPDTELEDAPQDAEGYSEDLDGVEETFFHGMGNALIGTYYNSEDKKNFNKIFTEKEGTSYAISDVNLETNYPRMDYYNQYVIEMVESFEFFDMDVVEKLFTTFPDVTEDHLNRTAINALAEREIIAGYPDGTFKPDDEINRAELTKMVVATRLEPDPDVYKNCFPDVNDQWFAPYICYAKEQVWVDGYDDGTFKPNQKITRVEAIKVILEVLFEEIEEGESLEGQTALDVYADEWYSKYFIFADNRGLLDKQHITLSDEGYNYYPSKNISRKEVAESIYRSIMNFTLPFL
ncbi:MAG: S-layer homology domain-containing protein [Nitrospirota bacterium]